MLILIGNPYTAEYEEYIPTAIILALSLKKWVFKNEVKFKYYNEVKSGLESLFKELGGVE